MSGTDLTAYLETSPVLAWLKRQGMALTRANYITAATLADEKYDWTDEDEAAMPKPLQDFDALAAERAVQD